MTFSYTTRGHVRGTCGHKHRTIKAAQKCVQRDREGCRAQGGYSDRMVCAVSGEPRNDAERLELELAEGSES